MKAWIHVIAGFVFLVLSVFTTLYWVNPREKLVYLPAPAGPSGPQEGPPDTIISQISGMVEEIVYKKNNDGSVVWARKAFLDSLIRKAKSADARATPAVAPQAVQDKTLAARDTSGRGSSIGLRLTTSRKTFTFNSLLGPSVATVEAKAPCPVASFWMDLKFPQQNQYVEGMFHQWKLENPPPPDRFMSGFGWGAASTLLAEVAIIVTAAIIVK